jgi:hypothetical protein
MDDFWKVFRNDPALPQGRIGMTVLRLKELNHNVACWQKSMTENM